MISVCRDHSSNVKRWRDRTMALRWCAAGMVEAGKQFRRVNGHLHLRSLRDTLERSPNLSVPPVMMRPPTPPDDLRAAAEVPRNSGHPHVSSFRIWGKPRPVRPGDFPAAGLTFHSTGTFTVKLTRRRTPRRDETGVWPCGV
jgi:hypothetical protein